VNVGESKMNRIWAPWRKQYIKNIVKQEGCFFCDMIKNTEDEKNLIVKRYKYVFVVLNKFPYTNGHLMIVPYQHGAELSHLSTETMVELMTVSAKFVDYLTKAMNPGGYNMGMNLGKIAGAGLEDHLHMHIVPRWTGDSNFMTTLGESRVISESLASSYISLKEVIDQEGV
jgi:ATP adenylyltransferase